MGKVAYHVTGDDKLRGIYCAMWDFTPKHVILGCVTPLYTVMHCHTDVQYDISKH